MYIQITTRCNMLCSHCGMNCTHEGEDMSIETFKKALEYGYDCVAIGGGEPTLHPQFWEILGLSIAEGVPWIATNGSQTETTLALIKLAKREVISLAISKDEYHDEIDPLVDNEIEYLYGKKYRSDGYLSIRCVKEVIKAGRAKEGKDECICEDLIVKPDGTIKQCGCDDAPTLGTIDDFKDERGDRQCWKADD